MSQSQVSEFLGWNGPQFISNIERGVTNLPLKYVNKICYLLQIERSQFFDCWMSDQRNKFESHTKEPSLSDDAQAFSVRN